MFVRRRGDALFDTFIRVIGIRSRPDFSVSNNAFADEVRPPLDLFENLGDVLADQTDRKKIYRSKEQNAQKDGSDALWRG